MASSRPLTIPFTLTDIDVGSRLYEALAQHAKATNGAAITYEDLLALARHLHPRDATLGRAVPVGIGKKLRFIEGFCASYGYPDLACLAVNKLNMRPSAAYEGDWEADRLAVGAFDWAGVSKKLDVHAAQARATVPPRFKLRKERPADVAWYAYFCSHREACVKVTGDDKKEIINLLMAGLDPETALQEVQAAKKELELPN